MNNQQTDPMVDLVIENLHLFGYTIISINEKTVTLNHLGKISSIPANKFMSFFNVHISFLKYMLDQLSE